MEKEDIVKYVMHTPANTNPAVLRSMLGSVEGGGGGSGFLTIIPTNIQRSESDITFDVNVDYNEFLTKAPVGDVRMLVDSDILYESSYSSSENTAIFTQESDKWLFYIEASEGELHGWGEPQERYDPVTILTVESGETHGLTSKDYVLTTMDGEPITWSALYNAPSNNRIYAVLDSLLSNGVWVYYITAYNYGLHNVEISHYQQSGTALSIATTYAFSERNGLMVYSTGSPIE